MIKENNKFAIMDEMHQSIDIVKNFKTNDLSEIIKKIKESKKVFLT